MGMPKNLVLVRHGQSQANIVNRMARKGEITFKTFKPQELLKKAEAYEVSPIPAPDLSTKEEPVE